MSDKILASILITTYNKDKFIKKTIESCLIQKFKFYEILVYDDVSSDNTLRFLKKYKKIKIIQNKKKNLKVVR